MKAERTTKGEHDLPGPEVIGIAERECRKLPLVDLDHSEVGFEIDPNDMARHGVAACCKNRFSGGRHRQFHAQSLYTSDDMSDSDDVAVRIHDDAGSRCTLCRDEIRSTRNESLTWYVRGCENLDKTWPRQASRRFDRTAQVLTGGWRSGEDQS